jgi:hypothetical protein
MKRILFLSLLICVFLPSCIQVKSWSPFVKTHIVTEEFHITRNVKYSPPENDKEFSLIKDAFSQKDQIVM